MTIPRKMQKKQAIYTKRKPQELSYVLMQLDSFGSVISYGYSDNNWTMATRILKNIQGHLLQSDRDKLAEIWRDAFVMKNEAKVTAEIASLKAKITSVG